MFEKNCPVCDKRFMLKRKWQKFCSADCRYKYWNEIKRQKRFNGKGGGGNVSLDDLHAL